MNALSRTRMTAFCRNTKCLNFWCKSISTRNQRTLEIPLWNASNLSTRSCVCFPKFFVQKRCCGVAWPKDFSAPRYLCVGWSNATGCRGYAKGQNKVKEKGSKAKKGSQAKAKVELSDEELEEIIDFAKMKSEMEETLRHLQEEYISQLSLRSSGGVFDSLQVDTPDGRFSLIEVAQIVQKNPNLVIVDVSAIPQYVTHVKTALSKSGMNLNPQQDGTTFFIPIPKVTREHREALAKSAKVLADKAKEKLRNIQNSYLKAVNKVKDHHSSNLIHNVQDIVKVTAKNYGVKADEMKVAKEKELLQK